ncbi:Major facilitator superfamily domain containing protein [Tylopilus felleus]
MSREEEKSESFTVDVVGMREKPDDFVLLKEENRKAAERHVVRKLDMRLMPTVAIIYLMNYIDVGCCSAGQRVAVTAAKLQGLEADLGLTDIQYETVIAVLYASYAPAQIPSNMADSTRVMRRPSIYIGACVVAWGLTSAATGVSHIIPESWLITELYSQTTKNFAGILACRIFIGIPEAAFYPGSMYLLSRWYTKKELALRSAILYVGLLISNAFGSFIAAGILQNMQGKLGLTAWRWLFYIEVLLAPRRRHHDIHRIPVHPHNTRWLSPAERRLLQVRMAEDVGEADQNSSEATIFDGFKLAIRDVKVWVFMLQGCSGVLGLSFINFFPTLTATLGYNTTDTLLMAARIDRTGERYFHMTVWSWITMVGLVISLATMSTGARYFSLFLMTTGFCGGGLVLNWVSNSIPRPPAKRAVALGLVNGAANLGNVMGSYTWKASWGPMYHQSMIIAICGLLLSIVLGLVMRQMLIHENKQMEQEEQELAQGQRERVEEAARLEGISFEEAVRRRRGFRYLY